MGNSREVELSFEGFLINFFRGHINELKVSGKSHKSRTLISFLKAFSLADRIPQGYGAFDYKKVAFNFNLGLFDFKCVL
ncbi:hypothetical protein ABTN00_20115, partial [Acinetobacter baumannii]